MSRPPRSSQGAGRGHAHLGARLAAALIIFCALLAAGRASGGAPPAAGTSPSGIRGTVDYGPTCPVQRPGQSCTRPYDARIDIRRASTGWVVRTIRSGADGRFRVHLSPGRYVLDPEQGDPYPVAARVTARVRPGRFTRVAIHYDSGIR